MTGAYLQLGYVTNDFDRAIALLGDLHAMGPFKEMRDLTIGARDGKDVTCHFGLAFKGGTQFEIIHPLSGDSEFYTQALPAGDAFSMVLHHTGHYHPDPSTYARAKADAEAKWDKPVDHAIFDGGYCYFDARADFGHYLELYCFPPQTHFDGVPAYQ